MFARSHDHTSTRLLTQRIYIVFDESPFIIFRAISLGAARALNVIRIDVVAYGSGVFFIRITLTTQILKFETDDKALLQDVTIKITSKAKYDHCKVASANFKIKYEQNYNIKSKILAVENEVEGLEIIPNG